MRVAVIGSRGLWVENLEDYLPDGVSEIVSGGARGIDRCARLYAQRHHIQLTEFLPDYARYGGGAPLRRNGQIVTYADRVLAFWDGRSRGTQHTISLCRAQQVPVVVYQVTGGNPPQRLEEL